MAWGHMKMMISLRGFKNHHPPFSRMLKKSSSFVLASLRPSTYPRGYALGLHSLRPCWMAFLSILRGRSLLVQDVRASDVLACRQSFLQLVRGEARRNELEMRDKRER